MTRKMVLIGSKPRSRSGRAGVSPERWIRGGGGQATKRLTIDIEEDLHKRVRVLAATEGRTMADIVREALEEACADTGRQP